jgi:Gram-negative bacterial TonB protein C-terminal
MCWWWGLVVLACLAGALAVPRGHAVVTPANPEDGKVEAERYSNDYFKLAYQLPAGWSEDREGPPPSNSGYYVLAALKGAGRAGTMVIAAQDQFFAEAPLVRLAEIAGRLRRAISETDGMTVDREPEEMTISGRPFTRLDFSGAGLYRMVLVTETRCHFVSFNLTTADPDQRAHIAQSLYALSRAEPGDPTQQVPICLKDYATPQRLVWRSDPAPAGPRFTPVPVRVIIGADGRVRHVHVIHGSAEQKQNIVAALAEWQFTPPTMEGRPVEVETGLTFRF